MEQKALKNGTIVVAIITLFVMGTGLLLRTEHIKYLAAEQSSATGLTEANLSDSSVVVTASSDGTITKNGTLIHIYDHRIFKLIPNNSDSEVLVITKSPLSVQQEIELAGFLDGTTDGFSVTGVEHIVRIDGSEIDVIGDLPDEFHSTLDNQNVILASSIDIPQTSILID